LAISVKEEAVKDSVLLFVVVGLAVLGCPTSARVLYVHPDSTLNSIQDALDSCATNDVVLVGPGTYHEHITWPATQGIDLVSEWGPGMTTIDGDSTGGVIFINGAFDTTTVIRGFTITGGLSTAGAGIYCGFGAAVTIAGNVVAGNTATDVCGGIGCLQASAVIVGNTVVDNFAQNTTGGIGVAVNCAVRIGYNTVARNLCADGGGGIGAGDGSTCDIIGNVVVLNEARIAAGIGARDYQGSIIGNTIALNVADDWAGGFGCRSAGAATFKHDIIVDNVSQAGGGLGIRHMTVSMDSCVIEDNGCGMLCDSGATVSVRHTSICGNGVGVEVLDSAILVDAEYNWWGDSTGPHHPTLNPLGLGDTVSDYVDFDPWLEDPLGLHAPRILASPRRMAIPATIIRGVLLLEGERMDGEGGAGLLDITGRRVMGLQPGTNDIRHLSPGVYFVRPEEPGASVRKVLVLH
jgi:hypothetical protein